MATVNQEYLDLLTTLAQIPAPSWQETKRAEFCKAWLEQHGVNNVRIDDAHNVICSIGMTEDNPLVVFAAHSDVVFPDTAPLPLRMENGRIFCPGIGDNSASVATLMTAVKELTQARFCPQDVGLLFVINAAEEGLGNLYGTRHLMKHYGKRIREFIAIDWHLGQGVHRAVGSKRFRIAVDTEGGHSYNAFGNRNAIAVLAMLIEKLYAVAVPAEGKTTYNVGTVTGGTSVNTIAQHAEMLYEFRSDERTSLDIMQKAFDKALEEMHGDDRHITATPVGDRPCSGDVAEQCLQALMTRAEDAYGERIRWESGSTDCNVPLSMGIPAVCVGCSVFDGAHTREEYLEIDSLQTGFDFILRLMQSYGR